MINPNFYIAQWREKIHVVRPNSLDKYSLVDKIKQMII